MTDAASIATWDVLQEIGFTPDSAVRSDVMPGLSFDFGGFKLSASAVMNIRFAEVVLFLGSMFSRRSAAFVQFEMLRHVESREQCAAWIVSQLDENADGGCFIPGWDVPWVDEGRRNKHLLPWERRRAAAMQREEEYRKRPHCTVPREWLKIALKTLAKYLEGIEDSEPLELGFDGKVLSFTLAGNAVVMAAEGRAWSSQFVLPASKIRERPKRIWNEQADVSVWQSCLQIDRYRFEGVLEKVPTIKHNDPS